MPNQVLTYEEKYAAREAEREKQRAAAELYLSLLIQAKDVFTEMESPKQGSDFTDDYSELFVNNTNNFVRVQVFADFITPGTGIVVALKPDRSDVGKVDVLALTANGKTESVSVILPANSKLYAKNMDSVFPLAAGDTIRVRLFDPTKLLSANKLFPNQ